MDYFIWPTMDCSEKDELVKMVGERSGVGDFEIIPVVTENWNDDLSPWEFKDSRNSFGGKSGAFLEKVLASVQSLDREKGGKVFIAGYSLGGLFSLWASSVTDVFDGVASCSGSLWFPGFVEANLRPKCSSVYLSLGDRESKTKHPLMREVETITKKYAVDLEGSGLYGNVFFEMNSGNHFSEPTRRLAKGMAELLSQ